MTRMHVGLAAFAMLSSLIATVGFSVAARTSTANVRQFVAGGNWQSHRDALDKRGWQIQMKHFDDDSLSGRIIIVGSPRLQQARLEGRVDGTQVYGVLVDDHDSQVGTFTGSIYQNSVSGTYTTADGDTGDWSYAGIESLGH